MKPLIQIKTTIPSLLVSVLLVCFTLLPRAQAVGPDTDGTIPGSNNGEGIGVLVSRTAGVWNTGTGFEALTHSRTTLAAATTRPMVTLRSIATPPKATRQLVLLRSITIQPVSVTQPLVFKRL